MIRFRWQHKLFLFILISIWVYTGTFQLFGIFPPDIERVQAAPLPTLYVDGTAGDGDDSSVITDNATNPCDTTVCATFIDQALGLPNTWVGNDTNENTGTQGFQIDDMPTDFVDMDTFSIAVRFRDSGSSPEDDSLTLTAQIVESDGSTALTNSITVHTYDGNDGGTFSNTSVLNFSLTGNNNKTVWDGAELELTWTYSKNMAGDDMRIQVSAVEMYGTYTTPTYTQSDWRIFSSNDSYSPGTPLAAESTAATLTSTGQAFRLRQLIDITVGQLPVSGESFRLEYATRSVACDTGFSGETYNEITTSSPISYYDESLISDGNNLSSSVNDPTHGAHTTYNQTYEEANDFTNSTQAIPTPGDGMWDFSLYDNGASAGTTYCIRVTKSDGTTISYSSIAEVTTAATPPSVSLADNLVFDYQTSTTTFETITITDTDGIITASGDLRISIASTTIGMKWDTTDTTASFGGTASAKASNPVSFENSSTTLVVPISSDLTAGQTLTISGLAFDEFNGVIASTSPFIGYSNSGSISSYASESVTIQGVATTSNHTIGQITDQWDTDSATTSVVYRYSMRPLGEALNIGTTTFSLSSVTGVENSNVNYARLYLDSNKDGLISTSTNATEIVKPVATSTSLLALSGASCSSIGAWECVNETTADDNTTYLYTSAGGGQKSETFLASNLTSEGLISKVTLHNEVAVTSSGSGSASASGMLSIDGVSYSSNSTTTPSADGVYVTISDIWYQNPANNKPWTWKDISETAFGIFWDSNTLASGRELRYTQSYLEVEYCDTTQYDCPIGGDWSGDVNISGSSGTIDFATSTQYHIEPRASSTSWTKYDVENDSSNSQAKGVYYDKIHGLYLVAGYDDSNSSGACGDSGCKASIWWSRDFTNWSQSILSSDFGSVAYSIIFDEDLGNYLVGGNDNDFGGASSNLDAAVWYGDNLNGLQREILSSDSGTERVWSVGYNPDDQVYFAGGVDLSDAYVWYTDSGDITTWNAHLLNASPSYVFDVIYDFFTQLYFAAGGHGATVPNAAIWKIPTIGVKADKTNFGATGDTAQGIVSKGATTYFTRLNQDVINSIYLATSTKEGSWSEELIVSGSSGDISNDLELDYFNNKFLMFGSDIYSDTDAVVWESYDTVNWDQTVIDGSSNTQDIKEAHFDDRNGVIVAAGYTYNGSDDDAVVWVSDTESYDFLLEMSVTGLANSDTITIDLLPENIDGISGYVSGYGSATGTISSVTHTSDVPAGNSAPEISGVTLNSGSDIVLNEGTYKWVSTTVTVVDDDETTDIASVVATLYLASTTGQGIYGPNCTADDLNCYKDVDYSACYEESNIDLYTSDYECGFKVWYVANASDSGSLWDSSIWTISATATDMSAATDYATNSAQQIEVTGQIAFDYVPTYLDYGTLEPGINTDTSNVGFHLISTGNEPFDVQVSGTDMDDGSNIITVDNQKYNLSLFDYDLAGTSLSGTPSSVELAIGYPTATTTSYSWTQVGGDGVNSGWNASATQIKGLDVYDRKLVAGLSTDEEIWYIDTSVTGDTWIQIGGDDLNNSWSSSEYTSLEDIAVLGDKLYASFGLGSGEDADVWEFDGSSWTQVGGDGINSSWDAGTWSAVRALTPFEETKIAATPSGASGDGEVWEYNGTSWTQIGGDSVNSSWSADSTIVMLDYGSDGYLYAGLFTDNDLWRYSTSTDTWSQIGGDGINGSWSASLPDVYSFLEDQGNLYVGLGRTTGTGDDELWYFDGSTWSQIGGDGVNGSWNNNRLVLDIEKISNDIFVSIGGSSGGEGEVWRYRDNRWLQVGGDSLNSSWSATGHARAVSMVINNGQLYTGLGFSAGDEEVWRMDVTHNPGNDFLWWGLNVPSGRPSGSYSGVNTISITAD